MWKHYEFVQNISKSTFFRRQSMSWFNLGSKYTQQTHAMLKFLDMIQEWKNMTWDTKLTDTLLKFHLTSYKNDKYDMK